MKRLISAFVAFIMILSIGCTETAPIEHVHGISAEIIGDQTRTSVTDGGIFSWSSGDQIWLETTSGSVAGTLSSGAGGAKAEFTLGSYIGELTGKAVYPYNSGHTISGNQLNMVLPASYDLGLSLQNTNAAMYGVNVNGALKFTHMAGVMRFSFKNVPAGVNRFTITLDQKINGTFTTDISQASPEIKAETTSATSEKTITLNFNPLAETSDIKLYVPLPTGKYTSLDLSLCKGEEAVWTYSNTVTNTISRRTLKLMPTVTISGSVEGEIDNDGTFDESQPPVQKVALSASMATATQSGYVLPKQTIGQDVTFGSFSSSYLFVIPAGAQVHIDPVEGGSYGFALCDTDDKVIEYTTNASKHSFTTQYTETHLWASVPKLGSSYYTIDITESNYWTGKMIWWCGTSIPAGGYPQIAGRMLGANVINTATGGSMCRANVRTGDYNGVNISNITSSLSMTLEEAEKFIENYDAIRQLSKNTSLPAALDESYKKRLRQGSFEVKLIPYLDGTEPMPDLWIIDHGHNDWKYRDSKGNIDIALAPTRSNIDSGELAEDTYMTETIDGVPYARLQAYMGSFDDIDPAKLDDFVCSLNRNCYYGALNFITTLILVHNPRARFMVIGNYSNEKSGETSYAALIPAQKEWAADWCFPFCDVAECLGTSLHIIPGTKDFDDIVSHYDTDVFHIYCPDGVHPSSDTSQYSLNIYAGIVAEFIKRHR